MPHTLFHGHFLVLIKGSGSVGETILLSSKPLLENHLDNTLEVKRNRVYSVIIIGHHMDSSSNSINIRTNSFSAYLDVAPTEDREIDVFQTEKYSNIDDGDENKHDPHGKTINNHVHDSSDLSWAQGKETSEESISYRMRKNRASKKQSIFSRFSCKGLCSDSESVRVSESVHMKGMVKTHIAEKNQNKLRSLISERTEEQEQFEFPVLCSGEEPRNSIEAFGSVAARKMTMVTWDAIPEADKSVVSLRTDSGREYETESYASSDLFEIDNISRACNMSGRKELLKVKDRDGADSITNIHHDRSPSEKSGLLLVCKSQRAASASESTYRDDQ